MARTTAVSNKFVKSQRGSSHRSSTVLIQMCLNVKYIPSGICAQRRLKSAYTSVLSDQCFHCRMKKFCILGHSHFETSCLMSSQRSKFEGRKTNDRGPACLLCTVELRWLEALRNHENLFETAVVRATEGYY